MDIDLTDLKNWSRLYTDLLKIKSNYNSNLAEAIEAGFLKKEEDNPISNVLIKYCDYINKKIDNAAQSRDYEQVRDLSELILKIQENNHAVKKSRTNTLEEDDYSINLKKNQRIITITDLNTMVVLLSEPFSEVLFNYVSTAAEKMILDLKQGKEEDAGYINPNDFPELTEKNQKGVYDGLKDGFKLALTKKIHAINTFVRENSKGQLEKLFERGAYGKTTYKLISNDIEIN